MPEQIVHDRPKSPHVPRTTRLPRGPDDEARLWQPPGVRKAAPLLPVPRAIRRDPRQVAFDLADSK
jgi:hypothetical protein